MWLRVSRRRQLVNFLATVLASGMIGAAYVSVMFPAGEPGHLSPWRGFRTGITISSLALSFEMFVVAGAFGRWLARQRIIVSFALRELILTLLVVGSLVANVTFSNFLDGVEPMLFYPLGQLLIDTAFAFVVTGFILFVLQMRSLIGPRTFLNILIGRYIRPVREERLFVLFDLVDSTRLAAEIGDERFHAFLSSVFADADLLIEDHGGEVHAYVGDSLIATWPLAGPRANAAAVEAVFAVKDALAARAGDYERRFGTSPRLRAALHGGSVVAGECGGSKRQITYLGDALNVTARIEGLAKSLEAEVLVSADLLDRLELPAGLRAESRGRHELKGLSRPIRIFSLTSGQEPAAAEGARKGKAGVLSYAGSASGAG